MAISEVHIPGTRYLETRAAQLAAVILTRQPEVSVAIEAIPNLYGLDLLVSLLDHGKDHGQRLGIEIKAVHPQVQRQTVLQTWADEVHTRRSPSKDIPFPVCRFVFTMNDDQGYWCWVWEPDVTRQRLIPATDLSLQPLTNEAVVQILSIVRDWYPK